MGGMSAELSIGNLGRLALLSGVGNLVSLRRLFGRYLPWVQCTPVERHHFLDGSRQKESTLRRATLERG